MKRPIALLLLFISCWGWITFLLLDLLDVLPSKWSVIIPLFALATLWGFGFQAIAGLYRKRH